MEYPFLMQTHKRQDVANGGMARTTREGGGLQCRHHQEYNDSHGSVSDRYNCYN